MREPLIHRLQERAYKIVKEREEGSAILILTVSAMMVTGLLIGVATSTFMRMAVAACTVLAVLCWAWVSLCRRVIRRAAETYEAKRALLNAAKIDDHYNQGWGEP